MGGRSSSQQDRSTSSVIDNSAYTRSDTDIDNRIFNDEDNRVFQDSNNVYNDLGADALNSALEFADSTTEAFLDALDYESERDQTDRSNVLSTATDLVRAQAAGEQGRVRLAAQTAAGNLASEDSSQASNLAIAAVAAVAFVAWRASS